jgi:beta-galactosidase
MIFETEKNENRKIIKPIFVRNITLLFLLLQIILCLTYTELNAKEYTPFSQEEISKIIQSESRFIVNLSGNWEMLDNDEQWQNVKIPSCKNTRSKIVYQRTVKIDPKILNKFIWHIYFFGIDDHLEVYFNNQFIGKYFGGMTPFTVQIPSRLIQKETNTIRLELFAAGENAQKVKSQYIFSKKIYTDIIRDVLLVGTPQIWISDIKYKSNLKSDFSNASVEVKAKISSGSIVPFNAKEQTQDSLIALGLGKTSILAEVLIKNKQTNQIVTQSQPQVVEIQQDRTIQFNAILNVLYPSLWSPESPNLYEIILKISKNNILIDDLGVTLGFHSIVISESNKQPAFFLNGTKLVINGIDYIEDYTAYNQTLTAARMENDIKSIKVLGANLIRFKYGVPHPYFAYLCDKYGLLMMIDLPIYYAPSSLLLSEDNLVRMRNISDRILSFFSTHPSLFSWNLSYGVEEGDEKIDNAMNDLLNLFKTNSQKMVSKTILYGVEELNHKNYDFLIIQTTKQFTAKDKILSELERIKNLSKGKPLLLTYGTIVQPDNHNGFSDPRSLEFQSSFIQTYYHIAEEANLNGSIIWSFSDYELESPLLLADIQDRFINTSGLTDRSRNHRISFATLQALFNKEKEPMLDSGTYTDKTPIIFIIVGLILSVAIIFMVNRFRRFREYVFRAFLRPYNFYADIRDQRIMSLLQTISLNVIISFTLGLFLSSVLFYLKSDEYFQFALNLILPWRGVAAFLFNLIWTPELLLFVLSLLFIILSLLISSILKLFTFFIRSRIFFTDTLTITTWASIPILILLPFSIVLTKLLSLSDFLNWLIFILFIIIMIWSIARIIKSSSVVFDTRMSTTNLVAGLFLALVIGLISAYYHYQVSIFSYINYFADKIIN